MNTKKVKESDIVSAHAVREMLNLKGFSGSQRDFLRRHGMRVKRIETYHGGTRAYTTRDEVDRMLVRRAKDHAVHNHAGAAEVHVQAAVVEPARLTPADLFNRIKALELATNALLAKVAEIDTKMSRLLQIWQ
jgi:hypothetical protein